MSLLAILISLALEKLAPVINRLRSLAWFTDYQQWIHARLANQPKWQGIPSLLLIVLLPVIGIAIIQHYLNDLLPLFSFAFSVIALIYCLGPQDEHRRVNDYLDAIEDENRSDKDSTQTDLSEILQAGGIASNHTTESETADETSRINQLIYAVLSITHDRMLAILFWFVVLGPMGAVLYRLTLTLSQNALPATTGDNADAQIDSQIDNSDNFNDAVKRLHHLLGWIPSHLTALSYAVMGSFVHALQAWKDRRKEDTATSPDNDQQERRNTFEGTLESTSTNRDLLLRIGIAALQFNTNPPQDNNAVRETLGLCGRSLIAWITVLAIMTLAGWAS